LKSKYTWKMTFRARKFNYQSISSLINHLFLYTRRTAYSRMYPIHGVHSPWCFFTATCRSDSNYEDIPVGFRRGRWPWSSRGNAINSADGSCLFASGQVKYLWPVVAWTDAYYARWSFATWIVYTHDTNAYASTWLVAYASET